MGKRLCNGDFSFLLMPLVSSFKSQSKIPKSLLTAGECLDRVISVKNHLTLMISV